MSWARKTLKNIASGEQYQALVAAIEKADYPAILTNYTEIARLIGDAEKEVVEKIQALPRRNTDKDCQDFRSALVQRASSALPQWYRLTMELQKQKIMDGVVFGFGSKGDPLVRTPEGRIVVLSGAQLKQGDKVKFKVLSEGEKLDFGRPYELTPETFYFALSNDTRQKIKDSLASIRERLSSGPEGNGSYTIADLSGPLKELEDVRELASLLQAEERDRFVAQVLAYRRRLLENSIVRLIFDFIAGEEKREIAELCRLTSESEPGLFRREAHEAAKTKLFAGGQIRGYDDAVKRLESEIDSMDSAVQLLDFKSGVDKVYAPAKRYLEKMDRFFENLSRRARDFAIGIAEDKVHDSAHVTSAIAEGFSGKALCAELRRVFRSAEEFFALRESLSELRSKLGDTEGVQAEAAIKPYLRQKIALAFGDRVRLPA